MQKPDLTGMPSETLISNWHERARMKREQSALVGRMLIEAISRQVVWPDSLVIWHFNQEGFAVKAGGKIIYFDLYLSNEVERLTRGRLDQHVRTFLPPVRASEITNADYVFCSHDHLDHLDPPAIKEIAVASPQARFIIPLAAKPTLAGLGIPEDRMIIFMGDDEKSFDGLTVCALPGAHTDFGFDPQTGYFFLGWVVTIGGVTLYHAGDTKMYNGLIERLQPRCVDVAFLPINGDDWFRHGRNIMGNLSYIEAADLTVAIGADLLIPMHFGQHEINTEKPGHLVDYLHQRYRYQKCHIMVPGERFVYVKISRDLPRIEKTYARRHQDSFRARAY